jgi:hypothetical protein
MTMPHEYSRALRWGWEFLWEMKDLLEVPAEIRDLAAALLGHYPTPDEIREWAERDPHIGFFGAKILGREETLTTHPEIPTTIERPPVSRAEYVEAIQDAGIFFLRLRGEDRMPEKLSRQIPYILRHFPIAGWQGAASADSVVPEHI